jgi:hypothetical protein
MKDEGRSCFENEGKLLPSEDRAKPEWEASASFHIILHTRKDATEQQEQRYEQLESVRAARYRGGRYGR